MFRRNKNSQLYAKIQQIQCELNRLIVDSKNKYYSRMSVKLTDPKTSPKTYWSILKTFLNNKKIPCIPPIYHDNKFITNFHEKAELFNSFFAKQCSLLNTPSILPSSFTKKTEESLSDIIFSKNDIMKIIQSLDPNKAHGHDMISIRMLKICGISICHPLELIFKSCMKKGKLPSI